MYKYYLIYQKTFAYKCRHQPSLVCLWEPSGSIGPILFWGFFGAILTICINLYFLTLFFLRDDPEKIYFFKIKRIKLIFHFNYCITDPCNIIPIA